METRACKQAIAWLEKRGVEVIEKDVSEAPGEFYSLPVTEIGDTIITGFNPGLFEMAIRRCQK